MSGSIMPPPSVAHGLAYCQRGFLTANMHTRMPFSEPFLRLVQWGFFDKQLGRTDASEADPAGRVPDWEKASTSELKAKLLELGFKPRYVSAHSCQCECQTSHRQMTGRTIVVFEKWPRLRRIL